MYNDVFTEMEHLSLIRSWIIVSGGILILFGVSSFI